MSHSPRWLTALHAYLQRSSFDDLKICDAHTAFLFNSQQHQEIPSSLMAEHFQNSQHYEEEILKLTYSWGLRFDPYHPYLSHEVQHLGRITIISPALLSGTCTQLFIRKLYHHNSEATWQDPHQYLVYFYTHFLEHPWLICGPSGVGKTTLLMQGLQRHCSHMPVVFMDRYQEGLRSHPLWTHLREQSSQVNDKGRVHSRHLLEIALKLRPSVLVFGEIRHKEITSFFHGLFSGHESVYGTFHAASPQDLWNRMTLIHPSGTAMAQKKVAALFLSAPAVSASAVTDNNNAFTVHDLYLPPTTKDLAPTSKDKADLI